MNLIIAQTETIKLTTSAAGSIHYIVNYRDENTNDGYKDNVSEAIITTATTTTILSAPATNFRKKVYQVSIFNNGINNTVTLFKSASSDFIFHKCTLSLGESIKVIGDVVEVFDITGKKKDENAFIKNVNFDAFARLRISSPETVFDSKQLSDKQLLFWDDQLISGSGGASTYNANQASTTLSVANLTAGKRARQTFRRFNYQPGKSQLFIMTGIFGTAATGIKRKIGLFDDKNGLFFDQLNTGMGLTIRTYTSGSSVDTREPQSNWNIDKLNGTGQSGINLDFSKCQIMFADFEWLGVGRVRFGFFIDGKPYYCHEVLNANNTTLVYMSVPNLPLRYEIENDGTGGAASLTHICSTVISEGGLKDTGFPFAIDREATALTTNNNSSIYPLLGIRLKSGYLHSFIKFLDLSITCTSTASYNYMILLNPTIVGTALTWSDITNSSCQQMNTSTNATTVTGGTKLYSKAAQQGNAGGSDAGILTTDFALGSTIAGVSDEVLLCVQRTSGTTETFFGSINFKDQQ